MLKETINKQGLRMLAIPDEDRRAERNCQPPIVARRRIVKLTRQFCPGTARRGTNARAISDDIPKIENRRDPKDPPRCLTRTSSRFRREAVPKSVVVLQNREYSDL